MLEQKKRNNYIDLYTCRTETTQRKVMYINDTRQIYKDDFTFRKKNPSVKRKEDILEKE